MRFLAPFTVIFLSDLSGKEFLLLERTATKKLFPNLYTGIGGHVDVKDGEVDTWKAAQRELEEETSILWDDIEEKKMVAQVSRMENDEFITLYVFSGKIDKDVVSIDCNEGTLHWVRKENVSELPLISTSRLMLENFFLNNVYQKNEGVHLAVVDKEFKNLFSFLH